MTFLFWIEESGGGRKALFDDTTGTFAEYINTM